MATGIRSHNQLEVYTLAFDAAMLIFDLSRRFPIEEKYSLTDQIRRCSRSVCTNIAEAWRKRRYEAAFISKLSDAESETAETQVWLEFAVECKYIGAEDARTAYAAYNKIIGTFVGMITHTDTWLIGDGKSTRR